MQATFRKSEALTDTIRTFWFEPERPMQYTAGQFTELTLKHPEPDERGVKRWFTLSSSPTDELVSITTRYAGDDKSSTFKKTLFALQPGDKVELADAMGDFVLPKHVQTPLIFVAGGIGITPFHSMFKWLADTGEQRDIRFLYAVNTEDDIIFQDTYDKAGVHATIIVGNPSEAWGGLRGRLDAETILGIEKPNDDSLIYLSGPEPMIEALEAGLQKHGVDKRQIVGDFFPGYTSL
jgi:ferredoxin-NADP reductase